MPRVLVFHRNILSSRDVDRVYSCAIKRKNSTALHRLRPHKSIFGKSIKILAFGSLASTIGRPKTHVFSSYFFFSNRSPIDRKCREFLEYWRILALSRLSNRQVEKITRNRQVKSKNETRTVFASRITCL